MIPKVKPFDCYKSYLGLKNHFTRESYDYHKYCGKSRASLNSFYKRKDRFFFEKLSRQKDDREVVDFFVSNFVTCDDPQTLWIGEIVQNGEKNYTEWKRKIQSLSYLFKEESEQLFGEHKVDEVFNCSSGHPIILKKYLAKEISLETLLIYDKIFFFVKDLDKKLQDPVWETVSSLIKKYHSFVNIDVFKFKKVLKQIVVGDS
jgi:hypothetical protein